MSKKPPSILKGVFRNGYRLTQRDYENWIDSYLNNKTLNEQSINSDVNILNMDARRISSTNIISDQAQFPQSSGVNMTTTVGVSALSRSNSQQVADETFGKSIVDDITEITSVVSTSKRLLNLIVSADVGREFFVFNSSLLNVGVRSIGGGQMIDNLATASGEFVVTAGNKYSFVRVSDVQWLSRSFN